MEPNKRLMSLDALRGADMLFIMGFSGAVVALCQLLGFGSDCWLAKQMFHADWHGFNQRDTIFPLFLFLAGVSWAFSLSAQRERGRTTAQVVLKVLKRVFTLWFFGLAIYTALWKFDFRGLRYDPVLAHIGICCVSSSASPNSATNTGGRWSMRLDRSQSNGSSCCGCIAKAHSSKSDA